MKEPLSKLPWSTKPDHDTISDKHDNNFIVDDMGGNNKQDFEYIVYACNNFPEAIKLLQHLYDGELSMEYSDDIDVVRKFLDYLNKQ